MVEETGGGNHCTERMTEARGASGWGERDSGPLASEPCDADQMQTPRPGVWQPQSLWGRSSDTWGCSNPETGNLGSSFLTALTQLG